MPLPVALLLLLAVFGTIVFLFVRSHRLRVDRERFLEERGLHLRSHCPKEVTHPFVYEDLLACSCYEGPLDPQRPLRFVLILGSRQSQGSAGPGQPPVIDFYIGAYLPSASIKLDDAWLNLWQQRVAERGDGWAQRTGLPVPSRDHGLLGPKESLPIRAVRTQEGGVLIAWQGLHLRDRLEKRLAELVDTLPR